MLIHIADAPAHGSCYHHPNAGDNHPEEKSDSCWPLLNKIVRKNIAYFFGFIRKSATDTMINKFNEILKEMQGAEPIQISQFNAVDPTLVIESINQTVSQTISAPKENPHFTRKKI